MRSSGLPRSKGLLGMRRIIGARQQSVVIDRPTETTGSLGETTTTTAEHTELLWLFDPTESIAAEIAGERIEGSLGALTVADGTTDLQHNDRVTHGGIEYEIDTIVGHPNDDETDATDNPDTDFWYITFTRRQ